MIAPQLEQGESTNYILPNNPVMAGECIDTPGGNPGDDKYFSIV